jgi:hypothetical protein
MTPALSEFIDALDRFVDESSDGHLTLGMRLKLARHFDAEFGSAAPQRRDLLAALIAREMFRQWEPRWLEEAVFDDDDHGALVEQFPSLLKEALAGIVRDPESPALGRFADWNRKYRYLQDHISPCLDRRAQAILVCCGLLSMRHKRLEEDLYREICDDHEWLAIENIDPQYDLQTDTGPRLIEDAWELLCILDHRYEDVEVTAPSKRQAWHWWLNQVRLVANDPDGARALIL